MRRHLWAVGLIVGAVLAVYSNALRNGFVGDDHVYIETNRFVQNPGNLKILADPRYYLGSHEVLAGSRPVYLASLMADRAVWGGDPAGYHATSVLIHAANSAWVYALCATLELAPPLPLLAGLLFGLHPIQTEAVDAVSFRADPLAAFFVFAALWVYLRARGRQGAKSLLCTAASALLYCLGLLSKEMAATLPALALLVELYFPSRPHRRERLAWALGAYAFVACGYAGFWAARYRAVPAPAGSGLRTAVDRFAAAMPTAPGQGHFNLGVGKGHFFHPTWEWSGLFADTSAATWTMIKALAGYFRLLLWPDPLVVDRAPVLVRGWHEGGPLLCLAALILAALYAVLMRRRDPPSAFGAAWCLTALLPVSDIIPLYNPVAERYVYLVTAGAALAGASLLARLCRLREARAARAAWVGAGLLVAASGLRTHARNRDWRDDKALLLPAARAPQSSKSSVLRAGLMEEDGRPADAIREYETALRLHPGLVEAWLGLGRSYGALGDIPRAMSCHERALALAPQNPVSRFAYAAFLSRIGKTARAEELYRQALALEPGYVEAWVNLGALYRETRRYRQARACYEKAVGLAAPGDPLPQYSYAMLLEKMGDLKGADAHYRAALEQDASFESARTRLSRLGARGL
ncbi:MAG: tetratricopeptide repeat protein [Elusimicrobia bacterium]|nr:tetratricopeptide repeat protein [Elusimicrobiota bacterium]